MTHRIIIYRYGHRPARDKRITTHVALTARAFGAQGIIIDSPDRNIEDGIRKVMDNFGGDFSVKTGFPLNGFLSLDKKYIHLTMYGRPLQDVEERVRDFIKQNEEIYIFVGAEKVPGIVYSKASFNVAVTQQPISEVSALAILLDRIFEGRELAKRESGQTRIIPNDRGKSIEFVPNKESCLEILRRHGSSDELIEHSLAVEYVSDIICDHIDCDYEVVSAGALLHDIGRTVDNGITHSITGKGILEKERISKRVQDIVLRHIGGGITDEEAVTQDLPARGLMPLTIEEKIVCTADNLVKGCKRISIQDQVERYREKGLQEAAGRIKIMYDEICDIAGFDIDSISLWGE
ncbi:MAG: HDIG domain-containing protein [Candidatus Thermoplasmatota archaeon]|nr:HDIG domain-containing protein [Candidatus Thermoplasmatota archaeon]